MKATIILLFSCLVLFRPVIAQETVKELITDRPDQTESAAIVPANHLQIETGFVFEQDKSGSITNENLDLFTTLLRYGINKHFELRLGTSILQTNAKPETGDETTLSGLSPVHAGIKFKMMKERGAVPEMAFLLTTVIPNSGKSEFSPEYLATEMRFALEYTLSDWLGFGMNVGGAWNGEDVEPSGVYSFVFGANVMKNTGFFLEAYGELPQNALPDHRMDAGFTYLLKQNLQFDASGGIGLSEISPDYFVSAGLSWRIPN